MADTGFHSDVDGDLFLHSDEPESDDWVVEVKYGGIGAWERPTRERIGFPAVPGGIPRNAWYVDRGSTVRLTEDDGTVTNFRT